MNTDAIIRPASVDDVSAILPLFGELMELHADLDPRYRLAPDADARAEAHLRAGLARPDSLCLVAVCDAEVVGYCSASVREHPPIFRQRVHGFISELHVCPAFRRRGIGRGLFEEVQRWLTGLGIGRVEVFTLNANPESRAFWQNLGCVPCAERRFLELGGV